MGRKRSEREITRAINRLRPEEQIPLFDLAGQPLVLGSVEIRPTARVLMRWGQTGKAGVYLDILFCKRRVAWITSREAIDRFRKGLAKVVAQPPS